MNVKNDGLSAGEGMVVIIVAAGSGARMGGRVPKQFLPLRGVPVLVRTLRAMLDILPRASFTVVVPPDHTVTWAEMAARWGLTNTHAVCAGGADRIESVRGALRTVGGARWVAVHDGVRPLVSAGLVRGVIEAARATGAAVPATPLTDTLRQIAGEGSRTVDRAAYRAVQTPQVFRAELLSRAYGQPLPGDITDDAAAVERLGVGIALAAGEGRNIKITRPEDMSLAAALLAQEER